jgi:hypothetical protein
MTIDQLKKGDRFVFNDETYRVTRKFINDDKPLISVLETNNTEHRFHWEGLEVTTPPLP